MQDHCFQFLLGNMGIIAVPRENEDNGYATSFFFGGGGRGGKELTRCIIAYGKMVNSIFCGICQYGLGSFSIYFRYCRDDCCLHQPSTSTINTIILGLRRVVFYDGSNWLIAVRGGVGLQIHSARRVAYKRKVYRFEITRAWYLSDRFHGSSSSSSSSSLTSFPGFSPSRPYVTL